MEGRGSTFGPPDRQRIPRRCRNTGSGTAGQAGLEASEQQPHLVLWDQGGPDTPGPRDAVQLRNGCRGHSLHLAWKGEKAHVGRRRGRNEMGRGKRTQRGRKDHGAQGRGTHGQGGPLPPLTPHATEPCATLQGPTPPACPPQQRKFRPGGCVSHSVISDSLRSPGQQSARLLRPWDFPGKDTRVGCQTLCQGIFPTQGSNLDLPFCRQILYGLSHQGSQPPGKPLPRVYSSQRI